MLRRTKQGQIQRAVSSAEPVVRAKGDGRAGPTQTGLAKPVDAQRAGDGAATREPFTYVHRGTVVIGELIATGRVRVHGEIRGNIKVDGVLEVAESGSVDGQSVEAHEVKVLGRVKADVVAGGKVEIWKGGVLTGNVRSSALDIEEGATFNGFSHMSTGEPDADESDADETAPERLEAPTQG